MLAPAATPCVITHNHAGHRVRTDSHPPQAALIGSETRNHYWIVGKPNLMLIVYVTVCIHQMAATINQTCGVP